MKFKDNTPGAETDYNTRLYANQMLEEVLRDLCIPGSTWKLGTGQPPQPIQLRRKELQPLARGWYQEEEGEHNEGHDQEEEADYDQGQDQVMFDAEDVYEPPHHQSYVEHETWAGSWVNHEAYYEQQQQNYYEPHQSPHQQPPQQQPQPQVVFDFLVLQEQQQQGLKAITDLVTNTQIDTLNYYEKIKTYQEYQYDQMKAIIAQQQEVIATQNREFQAMKSSQAVDGSNEELQRLRKIIEDQRVALVQQSRATIGSSQIAPSIEEKLDQIANSVKGFNEELATFKERHKQLADQLYKQYTLIRKEQESTSKEVKEIKERQINPVENETLKDVAKMNKEKS
ncbi:hypothetical protein PIB30_106550 [Stylosanthes scabra]|uniref:Uncharacterized protein n=1 Tax=Stylosanthes scabra TaxID=79078 RepID=A0ABU6W225_9FABA|nr:hypothetical protein [Stylosanthes scabra]